MIVPSSYSQRAPKISFYSIFPAQRPFLPSSFCYSLLSSRPTQALQRLPARGLPLHAALLPPSRQGRELSRVLEQGHLSGERLLPAGVEEGTQGPICICFYSISTPCTLTLSGKSLLDSLLGAQKGEEAGPAWKVPAWQGQPLPGE